MPRPARDLIPLIPEAHGGSRFRSGSVCLIPNLNGLPFPSWDGVAFAATRKTVDPSCLYDIEAEHIGNACAERRGEFAAGRLCARLALADLGVVSVPLPVTGSRAPLWPMGIAGSISHTKSLCCAVASRTWTRLGIDVEIVGLSLTAAMERLIFTVKERTMLSAHPEERIRGKYALYSAKEAAYKAMGSQQAEFSDFRNLEIELDWERMTFQPAKTGSGERLGLEGRFGFVDGIAMAMVVGR